MQPRLLHGMVPHSAPGHPDIPTTTQPTHITSTTHGDGVEQSTHHTRPGHGRGRGRAGISSPAGSSRCCSCCPRCSQCLFRLLGRRRLLGCCSRQAPLLFLRHRGSLGDLVRLCTLRLTCLLLSLLFFCSFLDLPGASGWSHPGGRRVGLVVSHPHHVLPLLQLFLPPITTHSPPPTPSHLP